MAVTLIVSVHDVAPATADAARRWAWLLRHLRIPLTFLVVPGPWRGAGLVDGGARAAELAGWLRTRAQLGDEVSLHGWCHRADVPGSPARRLSGSLLARGAGELWALARPASAGRARRGLEVLDAHGLAVSGTTPPGWLASRDAVRGLADAGLGYTTDHTGLTHLPSGRRWHAPALCHRPASAAAARGTVGEVGGRWVLGGAWRLVSAGLPVRIALHPDDLARPGLDADAVRAVERCLGAGARAATYRDVASDLGAVPAGSR